MHTWHTYTHIRTHTYTHTHTHTHTLSTYTHTCTTHNKKCRCSICPIVLEIQFPLQCNIIHGVSSLVIHVGQCEFPIGSNIYWWEGCAIYPSFVKLACYCTSMVTTGKRLHTCTHTFIHSVCSECCIVHCVDSLGRQNLHRPTLNLYARIWKSNQMKFDRGSWMNIFHESMFSWLRKCFMYM